MTAPVGLLPLPLPLWHLSRSLSLLRVGLVLDVVCRRCAARWALHVSPDALSTLSVRALERHVATCLGGRRRVLQPPPIRTPIRRHSIDAIRTCSGRRPGP